MSLGLKKKTVRIEKYNPQWKDEFLKEEKILKKALEGFDVQIEHVGSTSIVGCSAKPVVDIAVGVPSLEYGKSLIPILENLGWIHRGGVDFGVRWFLTKGHGEVETHFIHIEDVNSRIWQNHIVFRDYLNSHPEKVKEYSQMKELSEVEFAENREGYTKKKGPYIEETIKLALKEWNLKPIGEDYKI